MSETTLLIVILLVIVAPFMWIVGHFVKKYW